MEALEQLTQQDYNPPNMFAKLEEMKHQLKLLQHKTAEEQYHAAEAWRATSQDELVRVAKVKSRKKNKGEEGRTILIHVLSLFCCLAFGG